MIPPDLDAAEMGAPGADCAGHLHELRHTMRDLMALSTLPAVWTDLSSDRIAQSLAEVLMRVLSLDLIFVRLRYHRGSEPMEAVLSWHSSDDAELKDWLRREVSSAQEAAVPERSGILASPWGDGALQAAVVRFGTAGEHGFLLAGAQRPSFPNPSEQLLLGVAANQTEIVIGRRSAEEARRKEREWLSVTLASLGEAVIATDGEGKISFLNKTAEELTGYPMAEALGLPLASIYAIVDDQTLQPSPNPVEKVLKEHVHADWTRDALLVARDGTARPIDHRAAPIQDEHGTLRGAALIFRDATEQREAERKLRESQARTRLATDAAGLGVWVWHLDGDRVVWENDHPYTIFGIDPGEAPINSARFKAEFLHQDDLELFEQAVTATRQAGVPFRFVGRFWRTDGDLRWAEFTGQIIHSPEDLQVQILGTAADVTGRKRAEEVLRLSEERIRLALDSAELGSWHLDPARQVLITDERFRRHLWPAGRR